MLDNPSPKMLHSSQALLSSAEEREYGFDEKLEVISVYDRIFTGIAMSKY